MKIELELNDQQLILIVVIQNHDTRWASFKGYNICLLMPSFLLVEFSYPSQYPLDCLLSIWSYTLDQDFYLSTHLELF